MLRTQEKEGTTVPDNVMRWAALLITQGLADSSTKNYDASWKKQWVTNARNWRLPGAEEDVTTINAEFFSLLMIVANRSLQNPNLAPGTIKGLKTRLVNEYMLWNSWQNMEVQNTIIKRMIKGHAYYSSHEPGKYFPFKMRHILGAVFWLTQEKENDPDTWPLYTITLVGALAFASRSDSRKGSDISK